MRFGASAQIAQGGAGEVDPSASPATILDAHVLRFAGDKRQRPSALQLLLLGAGIEDVTLDLYYLVEFGSDLDQTNERLKVAGTRWVQFATGIVVQNGVLKVVTGTLPSGGPIYARRTADSITAAQTRTLLVAYS